MLYFPNESYKNIDPKKKIHDLGTNFYKKKDDEKKVLLMGG